MTKKYPCETREEEEADEEEEEKNVYQLSTFLHCSSKSNLN